MGRHQLGLSQMVLAAGSLDFPGYEWSWLMKPLVACVPSSEQQEVGSLVDMVTHRREDVVRGPASIHRSKVRFSAGYSDFGEDSLDRV
jgi:hypothetical protein